MRIRISSGNSSNSNQKQGYFLTAETIIKYLLGTDEQIETMILCKANNAVIATTDYELYQAFGSLKKYDDVERIRITKLLENVEINNYRKESGCEKRVLTHERVEELRKLAMNKGDVNE